MEAPKQYLNVEAEASNQLEGFITDPGRPVRRRWALTCAVTALVLMAVAFGNFGGAAALKASVNKASTALGKAFVGQGTGQGKPGTERLGPDTDRPGTGQKNEPDGGSTSIGDLPLLPVSSYIRNSLDAVDSLNRDIPQALRLESDPRRVAPTNWDVYTDDLVTEVKAGDPMALRLLEALVPSWKVQVKGKRSNQRVLEELRTCFRTIRFSKLVEKEELTVATHKYVDPSTQEEVIETRWTTKLPMKRLQPPRGLPRLRSGDSNTLLYRLQHRGAIFEAAEMKPDKRIVIIEALSHFYLNAEGKIYRQSIDELNLLVDGKPCDSWTMGKLLELIAFLPLPRLPLPPDNFKHARKLVEMLGDKLESKDGTVDTADVLKDKKHVMLYFSAHWCPPCRGFTPQLAKDYKSSDLADKDVVVIFISSDKDASSFKDYYGEMPWYALPFADRARKGEISNKFTVQGIPSLVVLDGQGDLVDKNGRGSYGKYLGIKSGGGGCIIL